MDRRTPHTNFIRVSNYKPATNQIELHPYLIQKDLVEYCQDQDIIVEAWSPLGANKTNLLDEPKLREIALTHKKSVA